MYCEACTTRAPYALTKFSIQVRVPVLFKKKKSFYLETLHWYGFKSPSLYAEWSRHDDAHVLHEIQT